MILDNVNRSGFVMCWSNHFMMCHRNSNLIVMNSRCVFGGMMKFCGMVVMYFFWLSRKTFQVRWG